MRRTLLALAACAALVFGTAGAAQAATESPTRDWFLVTTSKFVLTPQADGGYQGEATAKITYIGNNPDGPAWSDLEIMPPKGLNIHWNNPDLGACVNFFPSYCGLPGDFKPGVTRTIKVRFEGYAAPKDYAQIATGGWLRAYHYENPSGPLSKAKLDGVLASSSGSVKNPKPYVQSTAYDTSLTASAVTVVRGDDGSWIASVDLTARNNTDAYNTGGNLFYELPGGDMWPDTDPGTMCMGGNCELPGSTLYEGSVRTIKFTWTLDAGTAPGVYQGFVRVAANSNTGSEPTDATPANNTVALSVTIP